MDRVLIVVEPGVGVSAAELVAAWELEEPGSGHAVVERGSGQVFLPGLVEFVVLPLVVNVAAAGLVELVRRLVVRGGGGRVVSEVEMHEFTSAGGDRVVVVRSRRVVS